MRDPLERYFEGRGVALQEIAPGASTPAYFSSPAAEHLATRRAAGLFDFSFMACFEISGPQSVAYLQRLQVRDVRALRPGRLCYTLLCREDGTVLNDATVWCHGADRYWLFTGRRADRAVIEQVGAAFEVEVRDRSREHAVVAVQGSGSWEILGQGSALAARTALPYYGFTPAEVFGQACWVGRIGYSGETGYELVLPAQAAPELWERLRAAGSRSGLLECGFTATDSLRIEAGHILFARELDWRVTPYMIGLGRLVSAHRGQGHIGQQPLQALRLRPPAYRLVGLLPDVRAAEQAPALIEQWRRADGQGRALDIPPGTAQVTSACLSPLFEWPLALGYVNAADAAPGTRVRIGAGHTALVARLPFYDPLKVLPRR